MTASAPRLGSTMVAHPGTATVASRVVLPTQAMRALPERAVQFGTGAFLRGFVDYFLDAANAKGRFNGRVVAIGSTGSGRDRSFSEQDGLYTLVTRGLVRGEAQEELRVIGSVSRALSAVDEWPAVLECARNPELAVVFSNTTEVGILLDRNDRPDSGTPVSFPGKLTRFLYERARSFDYSPASGLVVIPCELIERNGDTLRAIVLELAELWGYERAFSDWMLSHVPFCNTLVDRIVPGTPQGADAGLLAERLGYHDDLLTTTEHFRLFVIEGDASMRARLEFPSADAGVVMTSDVEPYRERRVRLLNGAHTIAVSIALLAGCETVLDAMEHALVGTFIRRVLQDEILPTVDVPDADAFAKAVVDRFENPHIRHALADITLHGTTKLRVRIVPTLQRAAALNGRVPDCLALGFAAHLVHLRDRPFPSSAAREAQCPVDAAGDDIRARWEGVDASMPDAVKAFVTAVSADTSLWGADLTALPSFVDAVSRGVHALVTAGVERMLESTLVSRVA